MTHNVNMSLQLTILTMLSLYGCSTDNIVCLDVSHIVIAVVYHPPNVISHITSTHIVDKVDAILRQHTYSGVFIAGDINQMSNKMVKTSH